MKDLTRLADAKPTDTMEAFADFLEEKVYGGTLPEGFDRESFRKGVALGGSTRMDFQRSDEWKADPRNYLANVDANRAAKIAAATERAEIAKRKAEERLAALTAKLADAVAKASAKAESLADVATESADESADEPTDESADESAEPTDESAPVPTPPRRSRRAA